MERGRKHIIKKNFYYKKFLQWKKNWWYAEDSGKEQQAEDEEEKTYRKLINKKFKSSVNEVLLIITRFSGRLSRTFSCFSGPMTDFSLYSLQHRLWVDDKALFAFRELTTDMKCVIPVWRKEERCYWGRKIDLFPSRKLLQYIFLPSIKNALHLKHSASSPSL